MTRPHSAPRDREKSDGRPIAGVNDWPSLRTAGVLGKRPQHSWQVPGTEPASRQVPSTTLHFKHRTIHMTIMEAFLPSTFAIFGLL